MSSAQTRPGLMYPVTTTQALIVTEHEVLSRTASAMHPLKRLTSLASLFGKRVTQAISFHHLEASAPNTGRKISASSRSSLSGPY
ncbi:hypothetical protein SAMN02799620_03803 [Mycolicibacterium fluoranthenivorans]|uniref:Uncharacterized protein n=1 Tax=Mycolicibacterium fluoranthenivorans TaxID=258505 RepID=A0A1G4WKW1_9MYCO|nr:hypothetical protein SAMN02799620_03803 [Mycolicibacterium fluoranthenivorans]